MAMHDGTGDFLLLVAELIFCGIIRVKRMENLLDGIHGK
jgi:hypothetical protein